MTITLEQCYALYRKDIYRCALKYTRDHDEADDIVQETFMRAMQYWPRILQWIDSKRWFISVAANLGKDWNKNVRRSHLRYDEGMIATWDRPVDEAMIESEEYHAFWAAIETLPLYQRDAFLMSRVGRFTHAEIAAELETTIGSSKMAVYRARQRLATMLTVHLES